MGANKIFLIKLLNNFMELIFIAIRSGGAPAPSPAPPPRLSASVTWRVHSIISNGGVKPNTIPEASEISMYCRSPTIQEMDRLVSKVTSCFQAAAQATGCEVKINEADNFYTNVKQNSRFG